MFQGSNEINMDAKGRIAVPAKCREQLASACDGNIVVTAHIQDRCLLIYPEPIWEGTIKPTIQSLPNADRSVAKIQRRIIGYASAMTIEGNGRILIPPTLRHYAGLEKKLMLVGLGSKFEVWDADTWERTINIDSDAPLPSALADLNF